MSMVRFNQALLTELVVRPLFENTQRDQAGFSLIELMIVVALIGILSSFAVPSFTGYLQSAKASTATLALQPWQQGIALCWQEQANLNHCSQAGTAGIPAIPTQLPQGIEQLSLLTGGIIQATLAAKDHTGNALKIEFHPNFQPSYMSWELACSDFEQTQRLSECIRAI